MSKKLTTEDFIRKAKLVHGDKYDYSKVDYKGNKEKVCIICPEHGEFWQSPVNHCSKHNKNGCPKCSVKKSHLKLTTGRENFIFKAKTVHGDKYDYSKVEYTNNHTKVCIICPEHGEFWQIPYNHYNLKRGCPRCTGNGAYKLTTNEFIDKAKKIHGDKYDYSKVEYINATTKVCIICPVHGEFWQTPDAHCNGGYGCINCNNNKTETSVYNFLIENGFNVIRQKRFKWLGKLRLDFYLSDLNVAIEYQGEQHFHPVKYFGGEKRYDDRIERDERKKRLCEENGVKVIYFSFYSKPTYEVFDNFNDLLIKLKEYEI